MSDLLKFVEPRWQAAFLTFIRGEDFIDPGVEKDFVAYLERDPDCQRAVELAIARVATALQEDTSREYLPARPTPPVPREIANEPLAAGAMGGRR